MDKKKHVITLIVLLLLIVITFLPSIAFAESTDSEEEYLQELKETHPVLYNYYLKHRDELAERIENEKKQRENAQAMIEASEERRASENPYGGHSSTLDEIAEMNKQKAAEEESAEEEIIENNIIVEAENSESAEESKEIVANTGNDNANIYIIAIIVLAAIVIILAVVLVTKSREKSKER